VIVSPLFSPPMLFNIFIILEKHLTLDH
jgi:hypothetical protein